MRNREANSSSVVISSTTKEKFAYSRKGVSILAGMSLAMAGCGGLRGEEKSAVPKCADNIGEILVSKQSETLSEFTRAGIKLAIGYREALQDGSLDKKPVLSVAFSQVWDTDKGGVALIGIPGSSTDTTVAEIGPDSNRYDDPAELFCYTETESPSGDEKIKKVYLSPSGVKGATVLRHAGEDIVIS